MISDSDANNLLTCDSLHSLDLHSALAALAAACGHLCCLKNDGYTGDRETPKWQSWEHACTIRFLAFPWENQSEIEATLWITETFHKWGYPQMDSNGWFIIENPIKMDDLGIPPFQETSIWESRQQDAASLSACSFSHAAVVIPAKSRLKFLLLLRGSSKSSEFKIFSVNHQ